MLKERISRRLDNRIIDGSVAWRTNCKAYLPQVIGCNRNRRHFFASGIDSFYRFLTLVGAIDIFRNPRCDVWAVGSTDCSRSSLLVRSPLPTSRHRSCLPTAVSPLFLPSLPAMLSGAWRQPLIRPSPRSLPPSPILVEPLLALPSALLPRYFLSWLRDLAKVGWTNSSSCSGGDVDDAGVRSQRSNNETSIFAHTYDKPQYIFYTKCFLASELRGKVFLTRMKRDWMYAKATVIFSISFDLFDLFGFNRMHGKPIEQLRFNEFDFRSRFEKRDPSFKWKLR